MESDQSSNQLTPGTNLITREKEMQTLDVRSNAEITWRAAHFSGCIEIPKLVIQAPKTDLLRKRF
ncbi:predicted protein [Botrytis cinerea T4]|uniref:Uncharacterized protein n=1 Tax=Botryotinia fuckeliana (strain T4) TaxID=999810 RepID=G2YS48_BOTF4|nr:predicted protein [Botrytis cinerea T4]